MKLLEESGIKENVMKVLEKNPDADIAEILEYEISKDENLEDVFLEEAHKCAVNAVCCEIFSMNSSQKRFSILKRSMHLVKHLQKQVNRLLMHSVLHSVDCLMIKIKKGIGE